MLTFMIIHQDQLLDSSWTNNRDLGQPGINNDDDRIWSVSISSDGSTIAIGGRDNNLLEIIEKFGNQDYFWN